MPQLLDILVSGWWSLRDQATFYPDDLPADWQLSFFANAFSAVLVPYRDWSRCSKQVLEGWREDVHQDFRFYLESPVGAETAAPEPAPYPAEVQRVAAAEHALGDRLAGWVHHGSDGRRPIFATGIEGSALCIGTLCSPPEHCVTALRRAREWLEELPNEPVALLLEGASSTEWRQWRQLTELMGL